MSNHSKPVVSDRRHQIRYIIANMTWKYLGTLFRRITASTKLTQARILNARVADPPYHRQTLAGLSLNIVPLTKCTLSRVPQAGRQTVQLYNRLPSVPPHHLPSPSQPLLVIRKRNQVFKRSHCTAGRKDDARGAIASVESGRRLAGRRYGRRWGIIIRFHPAPQRYLSSLMGNRGNVDARSVGWPAGRPASAESKNTWQIRGLRNRR